MSSFVAPWLLWGIPLALLPIIIHLINQLRHKSVHWGAMQFLLEAKKMNKGMARLRQVLILAMRCLAILALIFLISRPLAGGWIGRAAGGAPEVILVLLDRSASMEESDSRSGESKRATGLRKVAEMLDKTATGSRLVLIESATMQPIELGDSADLLDLPATGPTSTSGDVPGLMERGLDYLSTNTVTRADVWLVSDLRTRDWSPESGRWSALREGYENIQGVRFAVLGYEEIDPNNVSVVVEKSELRKTGERTDLVLDLVLKRPVAPESPLTLPVTFVVNGQRTVIDVQMAEREVSLLGQVLEVDAQTSSGWGAVEIPADANPRDNVHYFVFSEPGVLPVAIVAEDESTGEAFQRAAAFSPDPNRAHAVDVLSPERASEIEWEKTAMVVWQGRLPTGLIAEQLENFVAAGRSVLFLPPKSPDETAFAGLSWGSWQNVSEESPVSWWRPDSDLLENDRSGVALPVGDLQVVKRCSIEGAGNPLARVANDQPLWSRARTDRGGVWFCGTWPLETHSSLARDGITFYVSLQRAIAAGSRSLGRARQTDSRSDALGDPEALALSGWSQLGGMAGNEAASLAAQSLQPGAFAEGDDADTRRFLAVNRPDSEDDLRTVGRENLAGLFGTIEHRLIADEAGQEGGSLVREIWKLFLLTMALALLLEALLCMPSRREAVEAREGGLDS